MKNPNANDFILAVAFLFFAIKGSAQPPAISFQTVISGLTAPVSIVNAGDLSNRLFIVELVGTIKVWDGVTTTEFMNLGAGPGGANIVLVGGEQGLLSMAFHPGYNGTTNRYFFVYYTNMAGDIEISRYQTVVGNSNLGDQSTAQIIMTILHPVWGNHNGGTLNFGPDGNLYFATGDGGDGGDPPNNAQNGNQLLGKMIRIDVDDFDTPPYYVVPADNPYVGDPTVDDRIWALGLRNPFRWSFDSRNGNMWIGDVGQGNYEEISFRTPANAATGTNYGWRCYEGPQVFNTSGCGPITNYTFPVFSYINGVGSAAVTGGYVYRGAEYNAFNGYYIASDYYTGDVFLVWPDGSGGWNNNTQPGIQIDIAGYGESENATLYAAATNGNIYKVVATGGTPLPVVLSAFSVRNFQGYNHLNWSTSSEQSTSTFHIEFSSDARSFVRAGQVAASRNPSGSQYTFQHLFATTSNVYYRLAIEDDNGSIKYSSVLKVSGKNEQGVHIYPTLISNGVINVSMVYPQAQMEVISSSGAVIFKKDLRHISGAVSINLPSMARGVYVVRISSSTGITRQKIIIQ